jgi:DNA-binding IclR family transcriptional regulator
LTQKLKQIAAQGYAVESGEYATDSAAVAAPVRDYTRNVVGSIAIAAPSYRLTDERIKLEIAPLVTKGAAELSGRLGYKP